MAFWRKWFASGDGALRPEGQPTDNPGQDRGFERRRMIAAVRAQVEQDVRANRLTAAPDLLWKVMGDLPRERFLPADMRDRAYLDEPLPIGHGQTISQPSLVALMIAALAPRATDRVLEVGVGSGYQMAVLAGLCGRAYGVELVPSLADAARRALAASVIRNAEVFAGDGRNGWPAAAPFDGIIAACSARRMPQGLLDQLKVGGRMVAPVGPKLGPQHLVLIEKKAGGRIVETPLLPVMFVPMVGT